MNEQELREFSEKVYKSLQEYEPYVHDFSQLIRDFCEEILEIAELEDLGGCRLCQS